MKKSSNIIITVLAVICCISTAIAGYALHLGLYAKENIPELYSISQLEDQRFDSIEESLANLDGREYTYPVGGVDCRTLWDSYGVQQAWVTTTNSRIVISAKKHISVIYAYNMSIPENNADSSQDRYYEFIDPTQPGYLIVSGVESGFAIIGISYEAAE